MVTGAAPGRALDALPRIEAALAAAIGALPAAPRLVPGSDGTSPVTDADRALERALRASLERPGEAWLSEEAAPTTRAARTWVVDPVDGTRELLLGLPESAVSVALLEDDEPIAAGVAHLATGTRWTASLGGGALRDGRRALVASGPSSLEGARVLASRAERDRGEWRTFAGLGLAIVPMGSVALRLARVASGEADATWTLATRRSWDVAAGTLLVREAGGVVCDHLGRPLRVAASREPVVPLVACRPDLLAAVLRLLSSPR